MPSCTIEHIPQPIPRVKRTLLIAQVLRLIRHRIVIATSIRSSIVTTC
jgi:hypothetical protein